MPASQLICPSTACWTQNPVDWTPNTPVTCTVNKDPSCIHVDCQATKIQAFLSFDLFDDTNDPTGGGATLQQDLSNGNRKLSFKNCGTSGPSPQFVNNGFNLDFDLGSPCLGASYNSTSDDLTYSFEVSLNDGTTNVGSTIEFHTDSKISGECKYPMTVEVDPDNFWVNQEDVEAFEDGVGDLAKNFNCTFSTDGGVNIGPNNIVNMGDTINGQVTSNQLNSINYSLTKVLVSDGNSNSFDVQANAAQVNGDFNDVTGIATGTPINFSWMSFGFSNHQEDQNNLEVKCEVKLTYVPPPTQAPPAGN